VKLSQAIAKARDITVPFEGDDLHVTYRPASFTIRELDALTEAQKKGDGKPTRQLLETVKRVILEWDLTDEDEKVIALDAKLDDEKDPLRDVPSVVFTEIMKKINEDQQPGGDKTSSAR